jgi:epoxyqueuosine reductase
LRRPSPRRYECDSSRSPCPWNVTFAKELPNDSPNAPRDALGGKDARTLARELLDMAQPELSAAFKGSPMKRAKLRGLERNAAVVLGNVGTDDDADVLTRALGDEEPLVREHAAWALRRLDRDRDAPPPRSDERDSEPREAFTVRR